MEKFEGQMPKNQIEARLEETANEWAEEFDPMSLVVLNRALGAFDVSDQLDRPYTGSLLLRSMRYR
jgi:homoserine acetyltransferase